MTHSPRDRWLLALLPGVAIAAVYVYGLRPQLETARDAAAQQRDAALDQVAPKAAGAAPKDEDLQRHTTLTADLAAAQARHDQLQTSLTGRQTTLRKLQRDLAAHWGASLGSSAEPSDTAAAEPRPSPTNPDHPRQCVARIGQILKRHGVGLVHDGPVNTEGSPPPPNGLLIALTGRSLNASAIVTSSRRGSTTPARQATPIPDTSTPDLSDTDPSDTDPSDPKAQPRADDFEATAADAPLDPCHLRHLRLDGDPHRLRNALAEISAALPDVVPLIGAWRFNTNPDGGPRLLDVWLVIIG